MKLGTLFWFPGILAGQWCLGEWTTSHTKQALAAADPDGTVRLHGPGMIYPHEFIPAYPVDNQEAVAMALLHAPDQIVAVGRTTIYREEHPDRVFEVVLALPCEEMRNSKGRPLRLLENGYPSQGGQWHYDLDGAKRRIEVLIQGDLYRKIAKLEEQVRLLEKQLSGNLTN